VRDGASTHARYRWADFRELPEGDVRELVDGRLAEGEMPTKWHEAMVALLIRRLYDWCTKRKLHVLGSGFRVRITDRSGALPDVQVLTDETYRKSGPNGLESGRPELVIEVISPTSRAHDRVRKVDWYARLEVPEYWIVDVDGRSIERLVFDRGTYRIAQHAAGDVVFRPKSMRGLSIPLAELWSLLD
jgi:Uma2 family endonuclease